jgi:uncharacterized protein DUF4062/NACHT domain-containing protein
MMMNEAPPTPDARVVRVFISSTFRDMQAEREELVKRIFPQLRKLCDQRGVVWGEVDLRWGITPEEAERGEVLPICLAEIERCRPYFIGLLGERYGWVPSRIDPEVIAREDWLAEHNGRSVTELEILHGVLNNPGMADHAFFYFRDPAFIDSLPAAGQDSYRETPTPDEIEQSGLAEAGRRAEGRKRQLADLKKRIRARGLPVREDYPNPQALGELVLHDLTAVIERLYPQGTEPNILEQEAIEHEAFAANCARVYIERADYLARLDAHIDDDGPPLVVLGESGVGKSALLANWALDRRARRPHEALVMHFTGATEYSTRLESLLSRLMWELKGRFRIEQAAPSDFKELGRHFASWLNEAAAQGRIVLVVDALDQLEDRDGAPDLVWLPEKLPRNVRVIVSTLPGRPLDELKRRQCLTLEVGPLNQDERERLVADYLAQYTKKLSPYHVSHIASATAAGNPLFLRALLEELRVYGEHETLSERIEYYLASVDVVSLYQKILARYEQDYERVRAGLVSETLSLLWAARRGLSEAELLDLLGSGGTPLPHLYWSPLYLALESSLVNHQGLVGFFHDYLRRAVCDRYLPTPERQSAAHRRLADYFARRELNERKVEELPWQLAKMSEWEQLRGVLADLTFLELALRVDQYDVQSYWSQIEFHTPPWASQRMVDAYRQALDHPERQAADHLSHLAGLFISMGHHKEALALSEYLIEHYRRIGDQQKLQSELTIRANILMSRGDMKQAATLLEEEERLASAAGRNDEQQVTALHTQASVLREHGDLTGALALFHQMETLARESRDRKTLISCLMNQSSILVQSDLSRALALNQEVLRLCRETGDKDSLQRALFNQSFMVNAQGDEAGALALLVEQEELSRELGARPELAASLYNQAMILLTSGGDRRTANEKCVEARDLFNQLSMVVEAKNATDLLRTLAIGLSPKLIKLMVLLVILGLTALGVFLGLWQPWLWFIGGPLILFAMLMFFMNFVDSARKALVRYVRQTQAEIERDTN